MRDAVRKIAGASTGAALLAALLAGVHVPASDPRPGAVLRVALRTTAGTVQDCRKLTQAELDALPMHMRRPEVCESRALPYRLLVRIDGRTVFERTYTASGIRGDRPLTIGEEAGVAAGAHDVSLLFAPAPAQTEAGVVAAAPPAAPAFSFEGRVDFAEGRVRVASLEANPPTFAIR